MSEKLNQSHDEYINLLDLYFMIINRKWFIGIIVTLATLATVFISGMLPKYYSTTAVVMPLKSSGGGMDLRSALPCGLANLVGTAGGGGKSQKMKVILKTRTMAEKVINKYNLKPVLSKKGKIEADSMSMEDAVEALKKHVNIDQDIKEGTISISSEFKSPELAAQIANGYITLLQELIEEKSFTDAKKNRLFIEVQLEQNRRELLESGKELNGFYTTNKVSNTESKVDIPISNGFSFNSLANIQTENPDNEMLSPDVFIKKTVEALNKKKDLQSKMFVRDVPGQIYLQYLTMQRSLMIQINSLLAQQYELAKIEEAKNDLAFEILDVARVPEHKSKPKRKDMVVIACLGSFFLSILIVIISGYFEKIKIVLKRGDA